MDHSGLCPKCGADWDNGDIVAFFKNMRASGDRYWANKTDDEIVKVAGDYGWTPETPKHFSRLIGIEHRDRYDGVWEYACPDCNARFPRFGEPDGRREKASS